MVRSSAPPDQLSPRAREIVAVARQLLEEDGEDALSTRRLAERLGIRAPSLYSHFSGKIALESELIAEGLWELGDRMLATLADGDDPLVGVALAYRAFAHEHPHLYRLMYRRPWDRTRLDPAAELHCGEAIRAATGGDLNGARVLWAFVHGMVELELTERLPAQGPEADELWASGLSALRTASAQPARD
jgi:AcrR family transcriptional regulator